MDVWKKIQLDPFSPPIWTLVGSVPGVAGPPGPPGTPGPRGLDGSNSNVNRVIGTTDGSNASAGIVGQIIDASVASVSGVSLVLNTAKTIISISLTPGRWMIYGLVGVTAAASTVVSYFQGCASTVDNSFPNERYVFTLFQAGTNITPQASIVPQYMTVSSTTIVYLIVRCGFTTSTCTGWGGIMAVRI